MADRRYLLDRDEEEGRRRSVREEMDVFDDEFEVEDFDVGVADGFRPGRRSDDTEREDHDRAVPEIAAHYAPGPVMAMERDGPSRNSTRKSRGYANPFASPEDEAEAPLRRTPSGNFTVEMAHRSVSSASSNVYASTHSPRITPGGPSHPYGMYPQGTMPRTPSIATQSTIRPQRNSSIRDGPTHPYAMYPQGVDDDLEDEHSSPQNLVPVGFPGLGQSYARRLGPEGEDQDLIGDFGHTEQLPPYTRYPEDGPEKPLLGVPDPPTALHSRAPVQGSDPGNPLMHTHLLPEQQQRPQSMADESSLRRQNSMASRRSTMAPLEPTSSSDTLMGNKSWNEKTWQERRRTRMLCGIPFIWLAIGLLALLFTGALVGGVIGGYVVGKSKGTKSAEAEATSSMYDASFIATPTSVPIPTGTFALSFGEPEEPDDSCLVSAAQAASWSCEFGGNPNTMIDVGVLNNVTGAYLFPGIEPTGQLLYGLQVSSLATPFEPFLLVSDRDDPENGHAFYFQTTYDKVVVLPGNALPGGVSGSSKLKRSYASAAERWSVKEDAAVIGDKPWFCYWNGTSVEGFIYGDKPIFSSTSPAPTSTTPMPTVKASNYSAAAAVYTGSKPAYAPSYPTAAPTKTITTTFDMTTTTCTYTGEATALPQWLEENYPDYTPSGWLPYYDDDDDDDDDDYDHDDDDDDGPPWPRPKKRGEDYSWMSGQSVPVFPYLIKIEERRREDSPQPYCQQYQLLNDGTWNWIPDPSDDSKPITITLDEDVPSYRSWSANQQRKMVKRASPPNGACHCQWMSGLDT